LWYYSVVNGNLKNLIPQIHITVPATNASHLFAALHPHTWLGDTGVGCVHRLCEHAVLDCGLPGADASRAASQTRLGSSDITLLLDA